MIKITNISMKAYNIQLKFTSICYIFIRGPSSTFVFLLLNKNIVDIMVPRIKQAYLQSFQEKVLNELVWLVFNTASIFSVLHVTSIVSVLHVTFLQDMK